MNTMENNKSEMEQEKNRKNSDFPDSCGHSSKTDEGTLHKAKKDVGDALHATKNEAEKATSDTASGISSAVDQTISSVSDGISDGFEATKKYLADQNLEKITDELSGVIKRYPIQSIFVGVGMGMLISNTLSRR